MTTTTKTPRLLEAAKEFNIGRETLVAFLSDKGFQITSNPAAKLTEQMYNALQVEFAQDKAAKRKSEEIALPKGSLLDSLRKTKDDLDITAKDKKEEPHPAERKDKKKHRKNPEKPEKAKAPEAKEDTAKKAADPATVVKEEVTAKKPATPKEEAPMAIGTKKAADTDEPAKKPAAKAETKTTKTKSAEKEGEDTEAPEHLDMKSPKIEGPNILGKINLDDMNLASRPKKGATAKKKETTKKEDKETPAPTGAETKAAKPAAAKAKKEAPAKVKEVPPLEIEAPAKGYPNRRR